ncbi:MAG: pseudouridine synthase [Methylophaga sp.]|nr:MAG: pseudouridine synthase [Methylophaga sp.]
MKHPKIELFLLQVKQVLIAVDQLLNTLLGLIFVFTVGVISWADETVSAKAYRLRDSSKGWYRAMRVFNAIFFWQTDHCKTAFMSELKREHLPVVYRNL